MDIDFLTVLHSEKAVRLYDKHIKLFNSRNSGNINPKFKVSCSLNYKKLLPGDVQFFEYEHIPQGAMDHAYNMHTLLNQVETEWFCMMDPDVYPVYNGWDIKLLNFFKKYDVFGIPYPISKSNRFYNFPMVHLMFFNWDCFVREVDKYNARTQINNIMNWSICMPQGQHTAKLDELISSTRTISRPYEITKESISLIGSDYMQSLLKEYNKRYSINGAPAVPDTCWKMPIVFKDLKSFCFKEMPIDVSALDLAAGRTGKGRPSFKYLDLEGEDLFVHLVYASNPLS